MVTAGPTREKIDPVRYITNHSSGKMGYAIAEEAARFGAEVVLISGPVSLQVPKGVRFISVESAEDMFNAVMGEYSSTDIVIKTAAVADYRPKIAYDDKVKKKDGAEVLELERTKDILQQLGNEKKDQILIGFAAETNRVEEYARAKLKKKNADMIVANNVKEPGAGFATDTNIVTIYKKDGSSLELPILSKQEVARRILVEAAKILEVATKDDC